MAPPTTGSHAPGWEIPFGRVLACSPARTAVRSTQPCHLPRTETQSGAQGPSPSAGPTAAIVPDWWRWPDCPTAAGFTRAQCFFQHLHFAMGCLPDCGCCPTARLGRHDLAASGRSVRQTGAPRQPPWPESVGLLPDSNNFPTARLCLLPDCPIGFCSPNTRLHVPDCYPTILQWPVYIYAWLGGPETPDVVTTSLFPIEICAPLPS